MSERGKEWQAFSEVVLRHIEHYTVPQYGDKPDDQVEPWTPEDCVRQIGKYRARYETGQRGPEEQVRDLVKIAHYACLAWSKEGKR